MGQAKTGIVFLRTNFPGALQIRSFRRNVLMNRRIVGRGLVVASLLFFAVSAVSAHPPVEFIDFHSPANSTLSASKPLDEFGIKEIVPKEFQSRYQKWKVELLSTDYGRSLWEQYANDRSFLLTIKVSASRKGGAGTDDFEWDNNGNLVAATVTLGKDLDKGFPDPVYYPVMNSLASQADVHSMTGDLLASTKFAHEIGHVAFTARINSQLFRKQNRLMDNYYNIFLNNGFNTRDPKLVSLETELGARPLDIWEDREYWSEVSALHYLVQKIDRESFYCSVISKIRSNVDSYAVRYKDRFDLSAFVQKPICGI
jgi:hypothetical protein